VSKKNEYPGTGKDLGRLRELIRRAGIDKVVLEALRNGNFDKAADAAGLKKLTDEERDRIEDFQKRFRHFDIGRFIDSISRHFSVEDWNTFVDMMPGW